MPKRHLLEHKKTVITEEHSGKILPEYQSEEFVAKAIQRDFQLHREENKAKLKKEFAIFSREFLDKLLHEENE